MSFSIQLITKITFGIGFSMCQSPRGTDLQPDWSETRPYKDLVCEETAGLYCFSDIVYEETARLYCFPDLVYEETAGLYCFCSLFVPCFFQRLSSVDVIFQKKKSL